MKTSRHLLAKTIAERSARNNDVKLLSKEIAAYLLAENRISELESLIRDIMQYRQEQKIVEAVAVSAHELEDRVLNEVKKIIRDTCPDAKQVIVRHRIDPSVIGGVRIQLANQQLDMTIKSKLDTFQRLISSGKE